MQRSTSDVITYNGITCRILLSCEAKKVLDRMVEKDLLPNVITCNSLINGYRKKKKIDEAMIYFQEIQDKGLNPNVVTYNRLIQDAAVFFGMPENKEVMKDAVITILIDGFGKCGKPNPAIDVFIELLRIGLKLEKKTYSADTCALPRKLIS
uniref:protein Rf1, mitochondrial-like n=1 Tax=Erigeron canadensis TaxID=72917 RepID=UPI001CB9D610|nr:protein Rf1, mitochondrial-like [Erigeron canadensis]